MITEIQRKQNLLSEHLLLLQQFDYYDPYTNYLHKSWRRIQDIRKLQTNCDVRLLDTLAAVLATGIPGDVYAAAFDKRQRFVLVLAKNDSPTEEDRAAAKELISLIQSPKTNTWRDLFPFLIKRCGANINHRIEMLGASLTGTLLQDFDEGMRTYTPNGDIQSEIHEAMLLRYGDEVPTFRVVWNDCIQSIIKSCKTLDLTSNTLTLRKHFGFLYACAQVVLDSRFLKWLTDDKRLCPEESRMRVERFKRRLTKYCQYADGIDQLIRKAKRLPPISHEWVTVDLAGSGQGPFSVASPSAHDAIKSIFGRPLDETTQAKVTTMFGPKAQAWNKGANRTVCVHAELRIILHFGPPSRDSSAHGIGVSKRSCLACALWIRSHNDLFETQWMTSGSYGKPCPNWALPGDACTYQSGDKVDKGVMKQVYLRLLDQVKSLIPGKRSGEESSETEEKRREYVYQSLREYYARDPPHQLYSGREHDSTDVLRRSLKYLKMTGM